jgi:hypothetical protein
MLLAYSQQRRHFANVQQAGRGLELENGAPGLRDVAAGGRPLGDWRLGHGSHYPPS